MMQSCPPTARGSSAGSLAVWVQLDQIEIGDGTGLKTFHSDRDVLHMKQHFIPQFLLRAWSATNMDRKIEVFRLDKPNFPSKRMSPKSTAYEEALYSLPNAVSAGVELNPVETETMLAIDCEGAKVLRMLNSSGLKNIEPQELYTWAVFLNSLLFRTPEAVSWLRGRAPNHLRASLAERPEEYISIKEEVDPPRATDFFETYLPGYTEDFGILNLAGVIENKEYIQTLLNMRWSSFDLSGENNHLILADRPCILTAGIDNPDLMVILPIGPHKVFIATREERVVHSIGRLTRKEILTRINEESLKTAKQRIYALNAQPRRFIQNRLTRQKTL